MKYLPWFIAVLLALLLGYALSEWHHFEERGRLRAQLSEAYKLAEASEGMTEHAVGQVYECQTLLKACTKYLGFKEKP